MYFFFAIDDRVSPAFTTTCLSTEVTPSDCRSNSAFPPLAIVPEAPDLTVGLSLSLETPTFRSSEAFSVEINSSVLDLAARELSTASRFPSAETGPSVFFFTSVSFFIPASTLCSSSINGGSIKTV